MDDQAPAAPPHPAVVPAAEPHPAFAPPAAVIEEPEQPTRIRRPYDALRLAVWLVVTGGLLLLGTIALGTTSGLEEDLTVAITTIPELVFSLLAYVSQLLLLAIPIVLVADLTVRRHWQSLLVATSAGLTAGISTQLFVAIGPDVMSDTLLDALTYFVAPGQRTPVGFAAVATIVAFTAVSGLVGRPGLSWLVWGGVLAYAALLMFDRSAAPLALAVSATFGRSVGIGFRYAFGVANPRPTGAQVARALARVAVPMSFLSLRRETDDGREYEGRTLDGRALDVWVIDRDRRAAGALYQVWRQLRVQRTVERRASLSLRRAVDQALLPVLAATAVGVRTPQVVAAASVNADGSVIALQHVPHLRTLAELPPEEISDELIGQLWHQARLLHRAGIAHEELTADHLAVDPAGNAWLLGTTAGEVAADQLRLRIDDAELLVSTALLVGPDRAVQAALGELTAQRLGEALPLLQPIALSRETRARLKSKRGLLSDLREAVKSASPSAPTEPVRLERLRPRIVVSMIALGIAVSVLLGQLADVDLPTLITSADTFWAAVSLLMSVLTYGAATLVLIAFAPIRLDVVKAFLSQWAASFVSLVAPAAVGHVGTNTRFVQQSGVAPALALASVGTSQVVVFISYLVLMFVFGFFTAQSGPDFIPGRTVLLVLAAIGVVGALTVAIPYTRRLVAARIGPLAGRTLPRLLEMLREPRRIVLGMGGSLLLNLAYVGALAAAVLAYGGSLPFATVGFVYLAAGAIGSAAPTPGGIGAVEAALAAGLTTAGLDGTTAVQAALLFRATTFWFPVVPGWFSFQWLQRRGAL